METARLPLLDDVAMIDYSTKAHFIASVTKAAAELGLPSSVRNALSTAAEVVVVAQAGHAPVTPEVEAIRRALQPIIERARAAARAA